MGISDEGIRLTLRLPERLRNGIAQQARVNMRSMNSEILAILEEATDRAYGEKTKSHYYISDSAADIYTALHTACQALKHEEAVALLTLLEGRE